VHKGTVRDASRDLPPDWNQLAVILSSFTSRAYFA
jgi:hypothetical protein